MSTLPPGIVAAIGCHLPARDRAALARASKDFGAAHDAVAEEDAWPSPTRSTNADGLQATTDDAVLAARARVSLLARAMPMLRTLRVGLGRHEEARAFVELGGGRVARFASLTASSGFSSAVEVARALPGRVGARVVYVFVDLCGGDSSEPLGLLERLSEIECVDVSPFRRADFSTDGIGAAAKRLVDAIPWRSAGVRSARVSCSHVEEAAALLALVPAHVEVSLRVSSFEVSERLPQVLDAVGETALRRLARLHVDSETHWGRGDGIAIPLLCKATGVIARLPPSCALSVSASLCSNVHVVPLLRHALAPDGMRRGRVEVVCGGGAGQDALDHFSLHKRPELPAQVHAAFACVRDARLVAVDGLGRALDEQPDGDGAAALSRLRADPETEGVAALWAYMGLT